MPRARPRRQVGATRAITQSLDWAPVRSAPTPYIPMPVAEPGRLQLPGGSAEPDGTGGERGGSAGTLALARSATAAGLPSDGPRAGPAAPPRGSAGRLPQGTGALREVIQVVVDDLAFVT